MAWELLFKSDFGLMSLFVILFVIVMSIFFSKYFSQKIEEDAKKQQK